MPDGFFDEDGARVARGAAARGRAGARRSRGGSFADGRTRAYAWGRAIAREDLAAATERLIAMSGQFEQRRLARPSYQLDVLDAFVGPEQAARRLEARAAWRALQAAERRVDRRSSRTRAPNGARLEELAALVEDTEGLAPGEEEALRAEAERMRHVDRARPRASRPRSSARRSGRRRRRAALAAAAEHALAGLARLAPELARRREELRDARGAARARSAATCSASSPRSTPIPARADEVEERLDRIADLRRRFRADTARGAARPSRRRAAGARRRSPAAPTRSSAPRGA